MPIRIVNAFVNNVYGLHARPCVILVQLQRHYFREDAIIVSDLTNGQEALLGDIMKMMHLASERGHELEFITHLDADGFDAFRSILFSISYRETQEGRLVKNNRTYDHVLTEIAECAPDRSRLITELRKSAALSGAAMMFTEVPPIQLGRHQSAHSVFEVDRILLQKIDQVDSRAAADAVKAAEYLSRCEVAGLGLIRKLCERLIGSVCSASSIAVSSRESLHNRVELLSRIGILTELDRQLLNFFRLLGNQSVHDSPIEDRSLLPDREAAHHVFLMFQQLLRQLLAAMDPTKVRGR